MSETFDNVFRWLRDAPTSIYYPPYKEALFKIIWDYYGRYDTLESEHQKQKKLLEQEIEVKLKAVSDKRLKDVKNLRGNRKQNTLAIKPNEEGNNMNTDINHEITEKMSDTYYDSDPYTDYGTLRTPKSETINVNGKEVGRKELGRRLVGVLANKIEINGKTFDAEQIGKILVDALEDASNPRFFTGQYEHVVEMSKMCGADIGYELDDLIKQALYVWKKTNGGELVPRKEYMPNTITLCKMLDISTEKGEDETEDEYNDNLTSAVEYLWKYGTAANRVKVFQFIHRTVRRVVDKVYVSFRPFRATPNDEDPGEFDREIDEEVEQDVEV